jgi:hypothetical protein
MIEQKFHFGQQLSEAARGGAEAMISLLGKSLPASIESVNGSMAKVRIEINSDFVFPLIEVPIVGSQYVRAPFQKGDKGAVISIDASIAAMIGMSNTAADLGEPGNISALVFIPLGNAGWVSVDSKTLVLTGLTDVMLRNDSHQTVIEDQYNAWNTLITQILSAIDTQLKALGQPGISSIVITNPIKARA